jgi:hypothetical protein
VGGQGREQASLLSVNPLERLVRLAAQQGSPGRLQALVEAEHAHRMGATQRMAMHPVFAQPGDAETAIASLTRDLVTYGLDEKAARTYAEQLVVKARRDVSAKVTKPAAKAKKKPAAKAKKPSSGK